MGFSQLTLIPNSHIEYNETEIKTMALHAFDIYENRKEFPNLAKALANHTLSVALSRRERKEAMEHSIALPLLPERLGDFAGNQQDVGNPQATENQQATDAGSQQPASNTQPADRSQPADTNGTSAGAGMALVFGRESSGLTHAEIDLCTLQCYIPTSPDYPSLNLAMAVQVVGYELTRSAGLYAGATQSFQQHHMSKPATIGQSAPKTQPAPQTQSAPQAQPAVQNPPIPQSQPATSATIDQLLEEPMQALQEMGFFKQQEEHHRRKFLQRMLSRSFATEEETRYFTNFLTKIAKIRLYKKP